MHPRESDVEAKHSEYQVPDLKDAAQTPLTHVSKLVPRLCLCHFRACRSNLTDGLKPATRILHSTKRLDDGRYNKVANIIGHTMQFHPTVTHLLAMPWFNWGRKTCSSTARETGATSSTGDGAAAPRYIEARLSKRFDVTFNPKTTEWNPPTTDVTRNPSACRSSFLLLAQGVKALPWVCPQKYCPQFQRTH